MHVKEILTRVIMGFYMGLFILDSLPDKYKNLSILQDLILLD